MKSRLSICMIAVSLATMLPAADAVSFDDAMYPDLRGQWHRATAPGPRFDQSKPPGRGQGAPLTAEGLARFEANLADMKEGGQGDFQTWKCIPSGMPMMMNAYEPMEIIVLPETTYIRIDVHTDAMRRIFTDGRDWPAEADPTFTGYSIGKWIDTDGDGKYDTLEVETRNLKGPRAYDNSGLSFHPDNGTRLIERIYLDKSNPNILRDEITVIDGYLSQPWTVTKSYRRDAKPQPVWGEDVCPEGNPHILIGKDNYMLSADGYLMPTRRGQKPPDMRYFQEQK
jgi:hypothetical protein